MPFPEQLLFDLTVVINLAVEGDYDRAIGVAHRLPAARREVYDREPPVAEAEGRVRAREEARIVRPPMDERAGH